MVIVSMHSLALMDPFVAIVFFVLLFSLGIVLFVIITLVKKRRKNKNEPLLTVPATFLGASSESRYLNDNFSSQTVIETAGNRSTSYYVTFRLKTNKKLIFHVKRKVALSYSDGDTGHLTYQGNRFVSFMATGRKIVEDQSYFGDRKRSKPVVMLYGEAQGLQISIASDKQIECDRLDLDQLIKDLPSDNSDWFFVLKNERGDQLQVEREGNDEVVCTFYSKGAETKSKSKITDLSRHFADITKDM